MPPGLRGQAHGRANGVSQQYCFLPQPLYLLSIQQRHRHQLSAGLYLAGVSNNTVPTLFNYLLHQIFPPQLSVRVA